MLLPEPREVYFGVAESQDLIISSRSDSDIKLQRYPAMNIIVQSAANLEHLIPVRSYPRISSAEWPAGISIGGNAYRCDSARQSGQTK